MPIVLSTTSDILKLSTSSTADVDFHAAWIDFDGTSSVPGSSTVISASIQTGATFVASPSGSNKRTVKTVTVRNKHAATANTITLIHTDGTNAPELVKFTLDAGDSLHYNEHNGWQAYDGTGKAKIRNDCKAGTMPSTGGEIKMVVLASDVADSSGANTYTNLTAMSFDVQDGKVYWFRFFGCYTAAATATGSAWSINGPASPTYLRYKSEYSLTTTSRTINEGVAAYDTPATANGTSATTGSNQVWIEGFIQPSADGTVIVRFATEVNGSAITCKAGSVLFWQEQMC